MHFPDAQIAGVRCLFESNASDNRFRFRPLLLPPSVFLLSLSLFFSFFNQRHLLFLFRRRCFPVRELFSVCHNPPIHPLVARSRTNDRSFSISGLLIIRVFSIPGEFSLSFGKMKIEVSASRDYDVYLSRGGFQARIIWHVKVFIASIFLLFLRHLETQGQVTFLLTYIYT